MKKTDASSTYAPKENAILTNPTIDYPSLTGHVSFPDGTVIAPGLTDTTFWNNRTLYDTTFINTTTDPWTSTTLNDYLKSATAANTYLTISSATSTFSSTYAPKASPTFTGSIVSNGNVSLAQTSANTLTLNDNLSLCTGTNYATPNVNNMLGYGYTGTIATDTLVSLPILIFF